MARQPAGSSQSVVVVDKKGGPTNQLISGFLDDAGDTTGVSNANIDFSADDIDFSADDVENELSATSIGLLAVGNGGPIRFTTTGTLPGGLETDKDYYPMVVDDDTIQIGLTVNEAAEDDNVVFTDTGTGVHTLHIYTRFYRQPRLGEVYRIHKINVFLSTNKGFSDNKYGGGNSLFSGIGVRTVNDDGTIYDVVSPVSQVKSNAAWGMFTSDVVIQGTSALIAGLEFDEDRPLRLVGDTNDRIEIILNDDLVATANHTFHIEGIIENGT